jgi:hypothetical protein
MYDKYNIFYGPVLLRSYKKVEKNPDKIRKKLEKNSRKIKKKSRKNCQHNSKFALLFGIIPAIHY